ncbi:MAG TPA: IS1182 family transposase [Burkholderiales bacterium]|nr:IS1182 family transposase [Burkholderiales bacterium]
MARYKSVDRSPRFLPIVLESQIVAGSFEHALDVLVDTEIDLSGLAARFCNDDTGAPAYNPAVMLKIVLLAYSRGVVSSRAIERLCRENVLFMAISGDGAPRFTTIAAFIRELGEQATRIFTEVLLVCERLGLIGRHMFAIDGVKLPSNADKRRSGTHAQLRHEAERMEKAVATMLAAHRERDQGGDSDSDLAKEQARMDRLRLEAKRIRDFLATHQERRSQKGALRKSNVTDNDSAKMATSKGVLQGYAAVAAVDSKAQVIVAAQAHGSGGEQSVLLPMVEATKSLRAEQTIITADAGYHSEANLRILYEHNIPALVADNLMRRREGRFKDQAKYKERPDPLWDKRPKPREAKFTPADFRCDAKTNSCICPAGKRLYSTGSHCTTSGRVHHKFEGAKRDCLPCPLRAKCLRYPERTATRQVALFAKHQASPLHFTERMKQAIDSELGRRLYARRIATVEPVFANLRHNKRLDRFTLRSQPKVNAQWHLYYMD